MTVGPGQVAAVPALLARPGVTVEDLARAASPGAAGGGVPAAGDGRRRPRRTYGVYWLRMATLWSDRRLDAVAADIEACSTRRWPTRSHGGPAAAPRHAGEHLIAAARAVYNRAIADGLIDPGASPHRVEKPRRLPSTRGALTATELDQSNLGARSSGNDVILDAAAPHHPGGSILTTKTVTKNM